MRIKHLLLILMAVVMLLPKIAKAQVSVWDGTTQAFTQGSGTESNPYLIGNAQQLAYIAERVNDWNTHYEDTYFKLTTDVQIDSTTQWQPIGADIFSQFSGHFDGDGHTITLYLNSTSPYSGIFGLVLDGSFSNLTSSGKISVVNSGTEAEVCIGGIVAKAVNTTMANCQNGAMIAPIITVSSSALSSINIGGIAGYLSSNSETAFTNCQNSGAITPVITVSGNASPQIGVGGVSGGGNIDNLQLFTTCSNSGAIMSVFTVIDGSNANLHLGLGGVTGSGTTYNCLNSGTINIECSGILSGGVEGVTCGHAENCQNSGDITISGDVVYGNHIDDQLRIGGIGLGDIKESYNSGNITVSSSISDVDHLIHIGGISGGMGNITKCHNSGTISAFVGYYVGGIGNYSSYISECFNTGTVISSFPCGIAPSASSIRNCYNVGNLVSTTNGAVCGVSNVDGENNYYLNTCGSNQLLPGGLPLTEAQMKSAKFVNLLNKDSVVFTMDVPPYTNDGYPVFGNAPTIDDSVLTVPLAGEGTQQNPYLIEDMDDLTWLSNAVNGGDLLMNGLAECHFRLVNDITINDTNWLPIGGFPLPFMGFFDGEGHTITWGTTPDISPYFGLFGVVYQGSVSHLHVAGTLEIDYACDSDLSIGGIVGCINSAIIEDCHNTSHVSVTSTCGESNYRMSVGGICGNQIFDYSSLIRGSSNSGNISCDYRCDIGGIAGSAGTIVSCYNVGNVYGSANGTYAGGIVGHGRDRGVEKCYNDGNVECPNGHANGIGAAAAKQCYNTGNISGTKAAGIATESSPLYYCYNMGDVTGNEVAGIIVDNWSDVQMLSCYNAGSLAGTTRWGIYQVQSGSETVINCYFLNTCGANTMSQAFARNESYMKSPAFVEDLNPDSVVYMMDFPPYVNQGYPIFGDVITLAANNIYGNAATLRGRYQLRFEVDSVGFAYKASTDSNYTMVYAQASGSDTVTNQISGLLTGDYTYYFFIKKNGTTYRGTDRTFSIVNCPFTLTFDAPVTAFCQGDSVAIIAEVTSSEPLTCQYLWNTGENTTSIYASSATTYSVTVTDQYNCGNTLSIQTTYHPAVEPTILGVDVLCPNSESTELTAEGGLYYNWSTGVLLPTIVITEPGTYSVTATNGNGCKGATTKTVLEGQTYNIPLTQSICQGENYNFYGQNLTEAGTYTHALQTIDGCDSILSLTLTVNPLPNVTISGNSIICQGESTTLTASGASSYVWDNASTDANITVSNAGFYTVTGTDANGCSKTASKTVIVNPTYNIPLAQSICQGESYNFYGQNLTVAGTYTHTLQSVTGCDSLLTLTLTVNPLPNVTISGNSNVCQGENTTLTASGASSYVWNNTSVNAAITVSNEGIYTVTGTDANGCVNTAMMTVSVNPTFNTPLTYSICQGESYNFYGQVLTSEGSYTHTLQSVNGCDSVLTLTLTVNPLPSVTISGNNSFCKGESTILTVSGADSYIWNNNSSAASITVNSAGNYIVTGTDANGCSNTAMTTVSMNQTYNTPLAHSICQGESYAFYGQILTTSGTYTHTLQTVNGCDSVLTLTLTVNPLPDVTISGGGSICDGDILTASGAQTYVWSNGLETNAITIDVSDIYSVTGTDANGCSNFATVTVSVNPTYNTSLTYSICQGESYNFYGQNLTTAGMYTHTLQSITGCDSVFSLTLTVNPLPNMTITGNSVICQGESTTLTAAGAISYEWSNSSTSTEITVSETGNYTVVGSGANGCVSTATLAVTVNPTYNTPLTQNICVGESYNFYGQELTVEGTYTYTLQTVNGCDSVLTLILIVNPLPDVTITGNSVICQGESATLTASGASSYVWDNTSNSAAITVSETGSYTVTGTDANGCVNTATVTVSASPTYNTPLTHSICQGESYNFYGQELTDAGTYIHTFQTVNGCDSVFTLTLTVNSLPNVTITGNSVICQGESTTLTAVGAVSYEWNNTSTDTSIMVSETGNYTVVGTGANGCVSTASLAVTVNPTYNTSLSHSICAGESYNFYGQELTVEGIYTQILQTINGCDSVLTLTLTVYPLPDVTITGNSVFCQGESATLTATGAINYEWDNTSTDTAITVSEAGSYTVTGTGANGCASSATLTVTVNPTYNTPLTHSICEGEIYNFYGQELTAEGIYTHALQTINGCDSVITLTLVVNSLPNVTISGNTSFCQGDSTILTVSGANSYVWSNASTNTFITVSESGVYTVEGTGSNGCSNTATVNVTVNPAYNITLAQSICEGESYYFHGQELTEAGSYTQSLQTINGCDSLITLILTVNPLPDVMITVTCGCQNGGNTILTASGASTYEWNDYSTSDSIIVTSTGIYVVTGTDTNGCFSTASVSVSLTDNPGYNTSFDQSICQGESYFFYGQELTTGGIYTHTLQTANGCDSTITLILTVNPIPVIFITGETDICAGESTTLTAYGGTTYLWSNGSTDATLTVSTAGTYQVIGYNEAGCNAMASATVNVWQPATSEFSVECPDSCYIWNDQSYCTSGDYTQTLQTVHGCDSVVTLHLTIIVGVDNYDGFDFKVYPNPTNGVVNVECTMNNVQFGKMELQLLDTYGRLLDVVRANNDSPLQTAQIDLSRYATGVYFVKAVTDGKVVAVRKVVKQ